MWHKIIQDAKDNGHFSDNLTLCCQNHPKALIEANKAIDFKNVPDGRCLKPCSFRLNCGHVCERACHPKDVKHTEYVCKKLCSKYSCQYGHKCKERCHFGIECGKCTTPVSKRITPCGHTWRGKCWEIRDQVKCLELVKKELTCGHYRDIPCYQDVTEAKCSIKCTYTFACGHERTGNCSDCNMGRLHIQCKLKCERILICCHVCEENCNEDCPPCKKKCENHCKHSVYGKECSVPCVQCVEDCLWSCQHKFCQKRCYEECDRSPCNVPCNLVLSCGQPCIGLCGEPCPNKCRICDHDEVQETYFGTESEPNAQFVQLEDYNHIFEVSGLDLWMEREIKKEDNIVKFKECPKCRTFIIRSVRYGNMIKRTLWDIENIKNKILNQNKSLLNEKEKAYQKCREFNKVVYRMSKVLLSEVSLENQHILDVTLTFEDFLHAKLYSSPTDVESFHLAIRLTYSSSSIEDTNRIFFQASLLETLFTLWYKCGRKLKVGMQKSRLRRDVKKLRDYVINPLLNQGQINAALVELSRIECYLATIDINQEMHARSSNEEKFILDHQNVEKAIKDFDDGKEIQQEKIEEIMKLLKEVVREHDLNEIILEERKMVTGVLGLGGGHWYKCPNGHYYCVVKSQINQEPLCPECETSINIT